MIRSINSNSNSISNSNNNSNSNSNSNSNNNSNSNSNSNSRKSRKEQKEIWSQINVVWMIENAAVSSCVMMTADQRIINYASHYIHADILHKLW